MKKSITIITVVVIVLLALYQVFGLPISWFVPEGREANVSGAFTNKYQNEDFFVATNGIRQAQNDIYTVAPGAIVDVTYSTPRAAISIMKKKIDIFSDVEVKTEGCVDYLGKYIICRDVDAIELTAMVTPGVSIAKTHSIVGVQKVQNPLFGWDYKSTHIVFHTVNSPEDQIYLDALGKIDREIRRLKEEIGEIDKGVAKEFRKVEDAVKRKQESLRAVVSEFRKRGLEQEKLNSLTARVLVSNERDDAHLDFLERMTVKNKKIVLQTSPASSQVKVAKSGTLSVATSGSGGRTAREAWEDYKKCFAEMEKMSEGVEHSSERKKEIIEKGRQCILEFNHVMSKIETDVLEEEESEDEDEDEEEEETETDKLIKEIRDYFAENGVVVSFEKHIEDLKKGMKVSIRIASGYLEQSGSSEAEQAEIDRKVAFWIKKAKEERALIKRYREYQEKQEKERKEKEDKLKKKEEEKQKIKDDLQDLQNEIGNL